VGSTEVDAFAFTVGGAKTFEAVKLKCFGSPIGIDQFVNGGGAGPAFADDATGSFCGFGDGIKDGAAGFRVGGVELGKVGNFGGMLTKGFADVPVVAVGNVFDVDDETIGAAKNGFGFADIDGADAEALIVGRVGASPKEDVLNAGKYGSDFDVGKGSLADATGAGLDACSLAGSPNADVGGVDTVNGAAGPPNTAGPNGFGVDERDEKADLSGAGACGGACVERKGDGFTVVSTVGAGG
jgi:hypothetical protein